MFRIASLGALLLCAAAAWGQPAIETLPVKTIPWRGVKPLSVEPVGISGGRAWVVEIDTFKAPGAEAFRTLFFYKKAGKNERTCWFATLDMATGAVKEYPGMPGLEVLPKLWVGGKLYMGMNLPGHLLVYDPAADTLTDLGNAFEKSQSIFKMAAAPDGTIACGGISPTEVSLYDPAAATFTHYGNASTGNHGYVYSIDQDNDYIYAACRGKDPWVVVAINKKTSEKKVILETPTDTFTEVGGGIVRVLQGQEKDRRTLALKDGKTAPWTPPAPGPRAPVVTKPKVVFDDLPLLEGGKELVIYYQDPEDLTRWKTAGIAVPLAGESLTAACPMSNGRLAAMGSAYNPAVVFDVKTNEGKQAPMAPISSRCMLALGDVVYATGYPGTVTMAWDVTKPLTRAKDSPLGKGIPEDSPNANPRIVARFPMGISTGGHIGVQMFHAADGRLYILARRHRHNRGFDVVWFNPADGSKGVVEDNGVLDHLQVSWATIIDGGTKLAIATYIEPNDQVHGAMPDSAKIMILDLATQQYTAHYVPFSGVKTLLGLAEAAPGKLVGIAVPHDQKGGCLYRFDLATGTVEQAVRYDSYIQGLPSVTGLPGAGNDFVRGPDGMIWTAMEVAAGRSVALRINPGDLSIKALGGTEGNAFRYVFQDGQIYLTGLEKLRRVVDSRKLLGGK